MKLLIGATYWLVAVMATACAPSANSPSDDGTDSSGDAQSIEEMQAQSLAEIDQAACVAKGGRVSQEGMMGLWRCVLPYSDANKLCMDGSDCKGKCLATDAVTDYEAGVAAQGRCQTTDSPFGCYAEIRNGKVDPMLCVD